jgi:uncharacterized integral membrane protein
MTEYHTDTPSEHVASPAASSSSSPVTADPTETPRHTRRRPTRIGSLHVGVIVAAVLLVLLVIFLIENARTVQITFVGAHLRVSLAVAMLTAAVAGALISGAAGMARIAQLRRAMRHQASDNTRR